MLVASEKLTRPVGEWVRFLGVATFLAGCAASIILHRRDLYPAELLALAAGWLSALPFLYIYRRGRIGPATRLRRLTRRGGAELTGTLRPVPGDPLAHAAPIAIQRPRKNQPGYRALSARIFDLELDDGRRIRIEPIVAILDSPTDTVPFGTRVTLSPATADLASYRDTQPVIRGTEEQPLVIRVDSPATHQPSERGAEHQAPAAPAERGRDAHGLPLSPGTAFHHSDG